MSNVVRFYGSSEPLPLQKKFHACRAVARAYVGGYGSGKTWCGAWESYMLSMLYPGTVGVVCRNTYGELRDSTRAVFFEVLAIITEQITGQRGDIYDPMTCPLVKSFSKSSNTLVFHTGAGRQPSTVLFRSLDAFEKFKSTQFGWVWIDEASDTQEEPFLTLRGRLRHPAQAGGYSIFLTTNPCNTQHWIYKRFVESVRDGGEDALEYAVFRAPTSENIHLPAGYEADLRRSYPAEWVARYLDGEFGTLPEGKPVYPGFKSSCHVGSITFDASLPLYRSWDFGSHHPACIVGQVDGDRLRILTEIQGSDVLINTFATQVLDHCRKEYGSVVCFDFCDPAGHQKSDKSDKTSIEILRAMGVFPRSAPQRILDGVLIVGILLQEREGLPGLVVHPSCRLLIEGFEGGYHYPKKFDGSGDDPNPVKDGTFDHLQDCLRYLVGNVHPFKSWLNKPRGAKLSQNSFMKARTRAIEAKRGRVYADSY